MWTMHKTFLANWLTSATHFQISMNSGLSNIYPSPQIFSNYSARFQRKIKIINRPMWGADQHDISPVGKGVFHKIVKSWSSRENTSTRSLWRSSLNEKTVLLCVHNLCRPQGYFSNRKKTVTRSLYCIFMVAFKRPVTVKVLPNCCWMFLVWKI